MQRMASTLALHREHHDYRIAVVVEDSGDAVVALKAVADGATPQWCTRDAEIMKEGHRSIT